MRGFLVLLFIISMGSYKPSFADTLNTNELEELMKRQDFQQISKILAKRPADDQETMVWLRSHKESWNPSLMSDLSFRLIEQIKKTPNKDLAAEISVVYSRAKTGYIVSRADCKTKNRQTQNHTDTISLLDTIIMNGFQPPRTAVLQWAKDALDWSKKLHQEQSPTAATWFCGADNVLPDSELSESRSKTHQTIEIQINTLLEQTPKN